MDTRRRTWVITDTHWFHEAIVEYCDRPKDHTEQSIKHLRHLLSPNDLLIHLGDVLLYKYEEMPRILESIPGRKYLIQGNHDRKSRSWYLNAGWSCCVDAMELDGIYLTHKPCPVIPSTCRMNLHGHWHRGVEETPPWYTSQHRLLSLEHEDYRPRLLHEVTK